jgi:ABC-type phosphate transport system substrate-binding protein
VGGKRAIVASAIVAVVAIGIAIAVLQPRLGLQPSDTGDGETVIANATEPVPKEIVSVASERSAFPFVQRWASQYNNDEKAVGSVELGYFLDRPTTPSDLVIVGNIQDTVNDSNYIPVSAQAAAVVYNIPSFPDIPSGMKLNASVLSSIFNGTITKWDDPAIKSLNSDMNLPSEKIIVVHENRNSSSLALLESYIPTDIRWPKNSVSALGPDELAAMIRKTPYSIGYVDFSYATQTRMTFAAIGALDGEYILPSMDSIGRAVNSSMQVQNVTTVNRTSVPAPPFMNASMLQNSSYPLTGLYYASWPNSTSDDAQNATLDFVRWMIDEDRGQQTLLEVQYPPIYEDNELLATYAGAVINSTTPIASKS